MTIVDLINILAVAVLLCFLIALIYLIALLGRANRILGRMENLSSTFRAFVADIVPAIVNVGTIATTMEAVLRSIHSGIDNRNTSKKAKK